MTGRLERLVDEARAMLGRDPIAVASAPGRVNLIGEHTDYNEGFVLPFAIGQRTVCAVARRDDDRIVASSSAERSPVVLGWDTAPGDVEGWGGYVAGTVWALRAIGLEATGGLDLAITSDVWHGAGLSSSAALEAAVALALGGDDLDGGRDGDRVGLVMALHRAENDYVGAPTGILDQSAALRCRAGHALLLDCRSSAARHVGLDLAAAGLVVLVADSREPHRHANGEYATRRADCERAAAAIGVSALRDATVDDLASAPLDDLGRRRARHVVTEDERVLQVAALLDDGHDPRAIGRLLTASHASMRDDFQITVPSVDTLVDAATDAGAHGARMTGGGFGGCVIALVEESEVDRVVDAMADAAAAAGHPAPRFSVEVPSPGAATHPV